MAGVQVQKIHAYTGHSDCVYTLEAYDDKSFFSSGGDGQVVLWSLDQLDQGKLIARVTASVYALHFDKNENKLIIGQNFDGLHLIDMKDKSHAGSLKLGVDAIFDIISDDRYWYIGTGGGELIMVDKALMVIEYRAKLAHKSIRTLVRLGNKIVMGTSDHLLVVFDMKTRTMVQTIEGHANSVFTTVVSPDQQYLLSAGRDAHLKIWDLPSLTPKHDIVAHLYAINHIAYSPDQQYFVTASMDKSIKVWDAHTFALKKVIDKSRHAGHGTSVNKLLWMPFSNFVISGSDDRSISVWKVDIE